MRRPSFQFYVGDWQSNSNLRRCTFTEKGIWLDVMCLMHDGDQYGVLRWPLKEIAQAVGCKLSELKSLVTKGVLKGADPKEKVEAFFYTPRSGGKDGDPVTLIPEQSGPLWYSSRMVKDEYVSKNRGKGTRFGEQKPGTTPEDGDQPTRAIGTPVGAEPIRWEGDGPSIFDLQSSTSGSKKEELDSAVPEEAAPPRPCVLVIRSFDDARAEVFGAEQRRAFPSADDGVYAERFLATGASLEWLAAFFRERMAGMKADGGKKPKSLRYFDDAVPEAYGRFVSAKAKPLAKPQPAPPVFRETYSGLTRAELIEAKLKQNEQIGKPLHGARS